MSPADPRLHLSLEFLQHQELLIAEELLGDRCRVEVNQNRAPRSSSRSISSIDPDACEDVAVPIRPQKTATPKSQESTI
jgi:hypothetical protein